jgi:pimeloyl-ACP methyl ester carboxylesterase
MPTVPTLDGVTSHLLDTERIRIHALTSGPEDGTPVVFVHGNVSSSTFWEETMLRLPDGFRGIAVDLRGYGDTERAPIDATLGMSDHAADVLAAADALGLKRFHLVGHSMGGGVAMKMLLAAPERVRSLVLVDPVSPYGYGGSKGADGALTFDDGAPSGVNPDFVRLLGEGDATDADPMAPRNVFRQFYVKPGTVCAREDALVASMLTTAIGDDHYPGTVVPSPNWPTVAPGDRGVLPSFNRKYFDASGIVDVPHKPPILWIRGADDQIVSDLAMFDLAALGSIGAVPGWPGHDACPPQPMLSQTRAVLDRYAANGGSYTEVVIPDSGHSPYLDQPDAFDAALHPTLTR